VFSDDQGCLIGFGSLIILNVGSTDNPDNMFMPINALTPVMADFLDQGRSEKERNRWIGTHRAEQSNF
jgi:hypothetical protein